MYLYLSAVDFTLCITGRVVVSLAVAVLNQVKGEIYLQHKSQFYTRFVSDNSGSCAKSRRAELRIYE